MTRRDPSSRVVLGLLALLAAPLVGCAGDDVAGQAPATAPTLDPLAVFTRASLDLRGVRPTLDELDRLTGDPQALDTMLDDLLDDPRFPERVKDLFAPAFRTRIDTYFDEEGRTSDIDRTQVAIGEEPLNLVAWIAAHDRPFTDVALADHTLVDPVLLELWPLEEVAAPSDAPALPGTVMARYTDGRPAAGVLTHNSLWWRHPSTAENANRGRANALSDALLCESYLDRPIAFPRDIDLTDSASIHRAIRENPACAACHATLDPLASHLWGFMYFDDSLESRLPYRPAQEQSWREASGQAPGYFGRPSSGLRDLGRHIAGDERFVMCAVRRVYRGLMARPLTVMDDGALAAHREVFLASGLRLKALIRSVLDDPAWRGQVARTDFGGTPAPATYTLVSPGILADELEALTGYRMRVDGRDLLSLDEGLRAVAGGSDRGSASTPSTGLVLVQRRLSEAAATAMVDGLTEGALTAIVGEALTAQPLQAPQPAAVADLLRACTTRPVDPEGAEVGALVALWAEIEAISDPRQAWIGLLTAVLADPERLLR